MNRRRVFSLLLPLLLLSCGNPTPKEEVSSSSEEPSSLSQEKEKTKVLFVGNSFTFYGEIPVIFSEIATSLGTSLETNSLTKGSQHLYQFADPSTDVGAELETILKANHDYDYVVLQEQSTYPVSNYEGFASAAKKLQEKINATQSHAKIYLYETWGYEAAAKGASCSIPEYEANLRKAYDQLAKEMDVSVTYVGKAFSDIYSHHPELNLYYSDKKHPGSLGSYLSACTHVASMLSLDPRGTNIFSSGSGAKVHDTYAKVVLKEETARILQTAAFLASK